MKKKILLGALSVVCVSAFFAGCKQENLTIDDAQDTYDQAYTSAQTSVDEGMVIDGKLDENWYGSAKWLTNATPEDETGDTLTKITTYMSNKGVYVGFTAKDSNIVNNGYIAPEKNTNLELYYALSNATDAEIKYFYLDTNILVSRVSTVSSWRYATFVDGEVNSGETTSFSAEIFIPWESLGVENENGAENEFLLYPVYRKVFPGSVTVYQLRTNPWNANRADQLYVFDKTGWVDADEETSVFGNADNGLAKQGRWSDTLAVDAENSDEATTAYTGDATTLSGFVKTAYLKGAYAENFEIETKIQPVNIPDTRSTPRAGIALYGGGGKAIEFCLNTSANYIDTDNRIYQKVSLIRQDLYFYGNNSITREVYSSNRSGEIKLKLVKVIDMYSIYANGELIYECQASDFDGNMHIGLIGISCNAIFSDIRWTDYDKTRANADVNFALPNAETDGTVTGLPETDSICVGDVLQFNVNPISYNRVISVYANGQKLQGVEEADGSKTYVYIVYQDKLDIEFSAVWAYTVSGKVSFADGEYNDVEMLLDGVDYTQFMDAQGNYSMLVEQGSHSLYFANTNYEDIVTVVVEDENVEMTPFTATCKKPVSKTRATNDGGLKAGVWNLVGHNEYGVTENEGANTVTQLMLGSASEYVLEARIKRQSLAWDGGCQVGFVVYAKDDVSVMLLLNLRDGGNPYMRIWSYGNNYYNEAQLLIPSQSTFPQAASAIMSKRNDFKMTVVKKGDYLYLFLNDVFAHRFDAQYGPNEVTDKTGMFGFAVRGKTNNGTTFSNYTFSVEQTDIENKLATLDRAVSVGTLDAQYGEIDVEGVTNGKTRYGEKVRLTATLVNEGISIKVLANGTEIKPVASEGLSYVYEYTVKSNVEFTFNAVATYALSISVAENSNINIASVTVNATTTPITNNQGTIYLATGEYEIYFDCGDYEAIEKVMVTEDENAKITLSKVAQKLVGSEGRAGVFKLTETGVVTSTATTVPGNEYSATYFTDSSSPDFVISTKVKFSATAKVGQAGIILCGKYGTSSDISCVTIMMLEETGVNNNRTAICGFGNGVPGGWFGDLNSSGTYDSIGEYTLKFVKSGDAMYFYINGTLVRTWSGNITDGFNFANFNIEKVGLATRDVRSGLTSITFSEYSYTNDATTVQNEVAKATGAQGVSAVSVASLPVVTEKKRYLI